jgi:hypothetical protein
METKSNIKQELVKSIVAAARSLAGFAAVVLLGFVLAIVRLLPVAARLACIGAEVYAACVSFSKVAIAYGSDATSILLALLVIVCPVVFTLSGGFSWGGLLVSAAITYGAGMLAPALSGTALALVIPGALGTVVVYFSGGKADEQKVW